MAKKVMVVALLAYFLLISCCMGAETQQDVCCTNPYSGCHKGNEEEESRCNNFCAERGCKGGECKNWGHPDGQCHCYC